ncbi:hypothetical protein GBO89_06555 [Pediococcus pentosaceus]|nr:MFS transporter [Pediococcus pentosaceus]KAF0433706.1 hypothetical protein GBO89_06555 [Pediococcus pentosaceus]
MIAGAFSDKTKSKYGKRAPWIIGGSFIFMLSMIGASLASNISFLLITWMIGQAALNFIVAPMVAWIDFAPEDGKGVPLLLLMVV